MSEYKTPKRKVTIMTRLSTEEKEIFDKLQEETGLNQSDYIRKCVLQKSFKINKIVRNEINTEDFKKIIGELGKIGGNINQISKSLNEGWTIKNLENTLNEELQELKRIKEFLIKKVEEYY